jgi:hypothetical protein
MEKMDIHMGDAVAILCFLKLMGEDVSEARPAHWRPATLDELTQYP